MRIGEVAHQAGVACSAIRFYEELGLLPEPARIASGYRDYDQSVVGRLAFIRAGQSVGLSLDQLREVFEIRDRGEAPCEHVARMLAARMAEIDIRIRELQLLRADLARMAEGASGLDPADCPPESICRILNMGQ
jgi:MerR family Zn(II)-responsive transcriptional regulator of zntA